jgi:hypothetical protein
LRSLIGEASEQRSICGENITTRGAVARLPPRDRRSVDAEKRRDVRLGQARPNTDQAPERGVRALRTAGTRKSEKPLHGVVAIPDLQHVKSVALD